MIPPKHQFLEQLRSAIIPSPQQQQNAQNSLQHLLILLDDIPKSWYSLHTLYSRYCLLNNIAYLYQQILHPRQTADYVQLCHNELLTIGQWIDDSQLQFQQKLIQLIKLKTMFITVKLQHVTLKLSQIHKLHYKQKFHHLLQIQQQLIQTMQLLEDILQKICDLSMGETLHYQYMKLKQYATHPDTYAGFVDIKKIYWKNFAKNGKNITQIFVDLCQSLTMNNTTEKCLFGEDTQINIVSTACRDMLSTMSLETITKITPLWMDDLQKPKLANYISRIFLAQLSSLLAVGHYLLARLSTFQQQPTTAQRHHYFAIELLYKLNTPYLDSYPLFTQLVTSYTNNYLISGIEVIHESKDEEETFDQTVVECSKKLTNFVKGNSSIRGLTKKLQAERVNLLVSTIRPKSQSVRLKHGSPKYLTRSDLKHKNR